MNRKAGSQGSESRSQNENRVGPLHSGFRILTPNFRSYVRHLFPLAVSALAFVAVFGWAVFSGKYLVGGDVFFYTYPMRSVAWGMIRAGRLPLWTPHILSGYPLLSMSQLALGYPLTWGHLFLPHRLAEQLYIYAPFLLAPAFTYAFARELRMSRSAAALAGLTFAYGGLATNGFGMNGLMTNAVMWLPLVLAAVERARRRPLAGCLSAAAAAYSMSVLTGHAQGFVPAALVALAYALFLSLFARPPRADDSTARAAGSLAAAAGRRRLGRARRVRRRVPDTGDDARATPQHPPRDRLRLLHRGIVHALRGRPILPRAAVPLHRGDGERLGPRPPARPLRRRLLALRPRRGGCAVTRQPAL
jgi:hypothetical protein